MLVNNLAVSFRFYRQNKIKTLFRQLEGNVSDVRVAELSAAKFSEE